MSHLAASDRIAQAEGYEKLIYKSSIPLPNEQTPTRIALDKHIIFHKGATIHTDHTTWQTTFEMITRGACGGGRTIHLSMPRQHLMVLPRHQATWRRKT